MPGGIEIESATAVNLPIEDGGTIGLEVDNKDIITLEVPRFYIPGSGNINFQIKKLSSESTFEKAKIPQGYSHLGDGVYKLIALKDPFSSVTEFNQPLTVILSVTDLHNAEVFSWHPDTSWQPLGDCQTISGNKVSCSTSNFSLFGAFSTNNTTISELARTGMNLTLFALLSLCTIMLCYFILSRTSEKQTEY